MEFLNENEILDNATSDVFRKLRRDALDILLTSLNAVDPRKAVRRSLTLVDGRLSIDGEELDLRRFSEVLVIGGGKASGAMAEAIEGLLGDRISGGYINVLKGTESNYNLDSIMVNGASHPVPSEQGVRGVEEMLSLVEDAAEDTLVLVLISGGGSALMTLPADDVPLDDAKRLTELLLRSGAAIDELNAVRKHISAVKGGQLARRLYPATVLSLILSDVVGDRLDTIASGPTAPDTTTFQDALDVLKRRGLWSETPESIRLRLESGLKREIDETLKPGDAAFDRVHNIVIGGNSTAANAALERARSLAYNSVLLSTSVEGEASQVGAGFAEMVQGIAERGNPIGPPAAVVAGGETTVTVKGSGSGGRNQELALSACLGIRGLDALIATLATDGIDGPTEAAGAVVDGSTLSRGLTLGLDVERHLRDNDSYTFFKALGDALMTGPTGTNVNDLTLILVSGGKTDD